MRISILTILPEMVAPALGHSIIGRALDAGLLQVDVIDIRSFAGDRHRLTDDTPCGGGGGMIMKPEPIAAALRALDLPAGSRIVLTDPQGVQFTQSMAVDLSLCPAMAIICGRYEGVDERVREHLVTDAVSMGDYVLTGGELPALAMVDAVSRLIPGVIGNAAAPANDSFCDGLLDHPHYTRPREFCGWAVPDVLFSGRHAEIDRWRRWRKLIATRDRRPDLWARFTPSKQDEKLLAGPEPGKDI